VEIEKNIPIPPSKRNGAGVMSDTYRLLEVGDSVALQMSDPRSRNMATAANSACNSAGLVGRKFSQRKLGDKMRLWRIK